MCHQDAGGKTTKTQTLTDQRGKAAHSKRLHELTQCYVLSNTRKPRRVEAKDQWRAKHCLLRRLELASHLIMLA